MRGNGFALAVRVGRQVDRFRGVGRSAQVMNDLALAGDDLQRRLENLFVVYADLWSFCLSSRAFLGSLFLFCFFVAGGILTGQANPIRLRRQVHHVADGGLDGIVPSQILIDGLRLGGRFDNDKRTSHLTFVTPVCLSERANRGACVLLATFGACPWSGSGL